MIPIVNGIKKRYSRCMKMERASVRGSTQWNTLLAPIGAPEFVLLDSSKEVVYRWFGVVPTEEFSAILDPLCFG